jgi:hypothetical protein
MVRQKNFETFPRINAKTLITLLGLERTNVLLKLLPILLV